MINSIDFRDENVSKYYPSWPFCGLYTSILVKNLFQWLKEVALKDVKEKTNKQKTHSALIFPIHKSFETKD